MKDLKTPTTKCQRCGFNPDAPADGAHCSFCGRGPNEFKRLIAGPMVFICDECIEICVNALSGINPEGIPELVKAATRAVGNPADGTDTCYCGERGLLRLTGPCWCCQLRAALAKVKP